MLRYTTSFDGVEPTDKLKKYILRKVRELEKYVPLKAREPAELTVHLQTDADGKTCRLSLALPHDTLAAHETTEHLYAALDITMAELRRQLVEYKSRRSAHALRRRIVRAVRRKPRVNPE